MEHALEQEQSGLAMRVGRRAARRAPAMWLEILWHLIYVAFRLRRASSLTSDVLEKRAGDYVFLGG